MATDFERSFLSLHAHTHFHLFSLAETRGFEIDFVNDGRISTAKKKLCIHGPMKINTTGIKKRNVAIPYGNKMLAIWISLQLTSSETTMVKEILSTQHLSS